MSKIVISIGGNALGDTPESQLKMLNDCVKPIVELIKDGNDVIIVHGNGPQVGAINISMDYANRAGVGTPGMPLPECGAMSQGYIGYHIQNALTNELSRQGVQKNAVTVVTQVVVDQNDAAFKHPTKPIGLFYSEKEKDEIIREKDYTMIEDSGRGWRRVVPSPLPCDIVEKDAIKSLVDGGFIVIAAGGGGIPVIRTDNGISGVPAVIDKDFASAKLSELVCADYLFLLTAVDRVAINFGTPSQKSIESMSIKEAKQYIDEKQFAPGSMLPKVEAAISFVSSGHGKKAVISALKNVKEALKGESGTVIYEG